MEDPSHQFAAAAERAAHGVGMPAQILRRAVDDQIGPERQRVLIDGCRGRVIHDDHGASPLCRDREPRNGNDPQGGIGRRLQIQERATGGDGSLDRTGVRSVTQRDLDTPVRQRIQENLIRPSIRVLDRDNAITGFEQRKQGVADGGHAGRKARRVVRALERADLLLKCVYRRVGVTRVDVAGRFAEGDGLPALDVGIAVCHAQRHGHHRCAGQQLILFARPHRIGRLT